MKFTLVTKNFLNQRFTDDYDEPSLTTKEQVEEWARNQVDIFNTYYPKSRRQFISIWYKEEKVQPEIAKKEVVDNNEHIWQKINEGAPLTTLKGRQYDMFRCNRCGITCRYYYDTKEYKRDANYTKKMYENCSWKINQ